MCSLVHHIELYCFGIKTVYSITFLHCFNAKRKFIKALLVKRILTNSVRPSFDSHVDARQASNIPPLNAVQNLDAHFCWLNSFFH